MKNLYILFVFLLICFNANSQCEILNPSFEDWTVQPLFLEDDQGNMVSGEVLLPDSTTSFLRFFFLTFFATLDDEFQMILDNDAQGLFGIDQSTDASDGDFSVKLMGGYDLEFADLYSVTRCDEVPESFSLDFKHFGASTDSIRVLLIFDEGLNPVPQDLSDLENYPAYALTTIPVEGNTMYQTLDLPIVKNNNNPVDTMYYIISVDTYEEDSYFLIDNLMFESGSEPLPEIVINELDAAQGYVELFNDGDEDIDLSEYYLNLDGNVVNIGNSPILCPDEGTILKSKDYLSVRVSNSIPHEMGAIAFSRSDDFNSTADLIGYVQWGVSDLPLEPIAVDAGLWTFEEFAPSFFASGSLEYDGDGIGGTDWMVAGQGSICAENGSGCKLGVPEIDFEFDHFVCICDEGEENLLYNTVLGAQFFNGVIVDSDGTILSLTEQNALFDFPPVCSDTEIFLVVVIYEGEIAGLEIGQNINDLVGCHNLSNLLTLNTVKLESFEFDINVDGVSMPSEFDVCLKDEEVEVFNLTTNSNMDNIVFAVIDLSTSKYIDVIENNQTTFEQFSVGEYVIAAIKYSGNLEIITQTDEILLNFDQCILLAGNGFKVNILGEDDGCLDVSTNDLSTTLISINPTLVGDVLNISNSENTSYSYKLVDLSGSIQKVGKSNKVAEQIIVSDLNVGMYIILIEINNNQYFQKIVKQ